MGEIEDVYREAVERLDEDFLDKIKKTKDLSGLEAEYLKKLKLLKEKYVKDSYNFLKNQKQGGAIYISSSEENFKKFKSSRTSMDFSSSDKKKIEKEIERFRFKRKVRDYFFEITPPKLIYSYYLFTQKVSLFNETIRDFITDTKTLIKDLFLNIIEGFQNLFQEIVKYISTKVILVYNLAKNKFSLLFKKKEEKKEETATETEVQKENSSEKSSKDASGVVADEKK